VIDILFRAVIDLVARAVTIPFKRAVPSGAGLTPASVAELNKQRGQILTWARLHSLAAIDDDRYTGVIGRFTVTLITFQRAGGALPLRLQVSTISRGGLPVARAELAASNTWKPLLEAHVNVQRIAAKSEGAEFVLDWNMPAEALTALLEALDARHQEAQSSYR
jgi:hypothetical protein